MSLGQHLTDEQWLALMRAVPDEEEAIIRFPPAPGGVARVMKRDGTVVVIDPSGETRTVPPAD